MAGKVRMTSEERKAVIIGAAKALFAGKGFNGTSVRDIAGEAGVSEALLYRHFPSKEAMYREILTYTGRLSQVAMKGLRDLEPGAQTLAVLVYALFRIILFEAPAMGSEQKLHERLLFYSLLEDEGYAKTVFKGMFDSFHALIEDSVEAAIKSGDLVHLAIRKENRFWFVHHLAMALNLCHLSVKPAFPYTGTKDDLAEEAMLFALRGIGLTDAAVKKYFKPPMLKKSLKTIFNQE